MAMGVMFGSISGVICLYQERVNTTNELGVIQEIDEIYSSALKCLFLLAIIHFRFQAHVYILIKS